MGALAFSVVVAGAWYLIAHDSGETAKFQAGLRLPQSVPEWLVRSDGKTSNEISFSDKHLRPYLIYYWRSCRESYGTSVGVSLGLVHGELEMDLGTRDKTPIEVDGVQGWLWHLEPQDFVRPAWSVMYRDLFKVWVYNRSIYLDVVNARNNPNGIIANAAIALQWNREGIHYFLIAGDREPMTEDVLLQIANSMAPSEYPSYAAIHAYTETHASGFRCP